MPITGEDALYCLVRPIATNIEEGSGHGVLAHSIVFAIDL